MTIDTSIGLDDPRTNQQSGITDEAREKEARRDGDAVAEEATHDLTREDIERGDDAGVEARDTHEDAPGDAHEVGQNDRNTTADYHNRAGRTNKLPDPGITISDA